MEENHKEDPFVPKPDTTSVNTVIKALSQGGFAERAEELVYKMEANEKSGLAPDAFSYTALITAYGRSTLEMKAEKAYKVLRRQIEAYEKGNLKARPNILAFNALLSKLSRRIYWNYLPRGRSAFSLSVVSCSLSPYFHFRRVCICQW